MSKPMCVGCWHADPDYCAEHALMSVAAGAASPVMQGNDGEWYFWDEASAPHGPYDSEKEAYVALRSYVKEELGE